MRSKVLIVVYFLMSACVETSVQPLTKTSFKVATEAEDICGAKATREIAFKMAAVEVIQRGSDRFIVVADQSRSAITSVDYTDFTGLIVSGSSFQDMVIQIIGKGDPRYRDALSAREVLGPDWQAIVAKGKVDNCLSE
jgi:hypothetical protein